MSSLGFHVTLEATSDLVGANAAASNADTGTRGHCHPYAVLQGISGTRFHAVDRILYLRESPQGLYP
jgi:hypothetical protein